LTSTRRKDTQTIQFTAQEINALIVDGIQEKKGQKIVLLDLRELDEASAEYYIICEGTSHTQVKAIADSVLFTLGHFINWKHFGEMHNKLILKMFEQNNPAQMPLNVCR